MTYEANKCFTLVDHTNTAGSTEYYPSSTGYEMTGRTVFSLFASAATANATLTVEASIAPTGTTKVWVDITKMFKNLNTALDGSASFVLSGSNVALQLNGINVEHIRVKSVEVAGAVVRMTARVM